MASYFYALHLESRWQPANPRTRQELEQYLSLYTAHRIAPSESLWGKTYKLGSNEEMIQYRILYRAPLDVVYDEKSRVVRIFRSYE